MGNKNRSIAIVLYMLVMSGCSSSTDPEDIINKSIAVHGGSRFDHAHIEFDFRGRHYTSHRDGGVFEYGREFTDTVGRVKDVLNNKGFERYINGERMEVTEERAHAYTSSIDGVMYFALLPFRLNDPAVRKEYVGETTIKEKHYKKVRVTFVHEDGGVDYDDIFMYWINDETHRMDYFAYSYKSDGGGIRFREATTAPEDNGIIVQNYINYKPREDNVTVEEMENLYISNQLDTLSRVVHENLKVTLLLGNK